LETRNEIRKTISTHVTKFDRFEQEDSYRTQLFLGDPIMHDKLSEDFEIHFIALEKFIKNMDELKGKLDHWMYFLAAMNKYEKDNIPEIFKIDRDFKVAYETLQNLELDPSAEENYEKQ
jgi:hypothetical protein